MLKFTVRPLALTLIESIASQLDRPTSVFIVARFFLVVELHLVERTTGVKRSASTIAQIILPDEFKGFKLRRNC